MKTFLLAVTSLALALAVCLSPPAKAQTYGAATFVQKSNAYAVGTAKLYSEFKKGNVEVSTDALLGVNVTKPSGAFGCSEVITYDAKKGWLFYAGPGIAKPLSSFSYETLKSTTWKDFGIVFGIKAPVDLSAIFGGNTPSAGTLHAIDL